MYHLGLHGSSLMSSVPLCPPAFGSVILRVIFMLKVTWYLKKSYCGFTYPGCTPERGRQKKSLPVRLLEELSQQSVSWFQFTSHWPPHPQERLGKWAGFWFALFWFYIGYVAYCSSQDPLTEKVWQPWDLVGSWWFLSQWLTSSRVWEVWTLRHGNVCYDITRFHL